MYALKRIVAYAIDVALMSSLMWAGMFYLQSKMLHLRDPQMQGFASLATGALSLFGPVLILGTLTGLTGRTPGKFITFLKVQDHAGDPPGIANGIVREVVKAVSLCCFFGMIRGMQAVVTKERTFYDNWLDLDVEDLRPAGLTPTQRNFRKYMRQRAREQQRR